MSEHVQRIGVAGYMGSGKSIVSAALTRQDGELIVADKVAKELMTSDEAIRERLAEAFGPEVTDGGTISFERLGAKVFACHGDLDTLNAIVHPPLLERLRVLLDSPTARRCVLDAALIPLWGIEEWFDVRIWVAAAFETRVGRLMARDGRGREDVVRRAAMQQELFGAPPEQNWTIVSNEGSVEELERAVARRVPPAA